MTRYNLKVVMPSHNTFSFATNVGLNDAGERQSSF